MTLINMRVLDPHILDSPHAIYTVHLDDTRKYGSPGSSYFGLTSRLVMFWAGFGPAWPGSGFPILQSRPGWLALAWPWPGLA
jgi:hypothetical protein